MKVRFRLNGNPVEVDVDHNEVLLNTLRYRLGIKSVKRGCERGECGACTVLLNGEPVVSCMLLTPQVEDMEITTVEGLEKDPLFQELVKSFAEEGAIQCGFCTPGFLLVAWARIREGRIRGKDDAKKLIGNLCRCTGYIKIMEAIAKASVRGGGLERV